MKLIFLAMLVVAALAFGGEAHAQNIVGGGNCSSCSISNPPSSSDLTALNGIATGIGFSGDTIAAGDVVKLCNNVKCALYTFGGKMFAWSYHSSASGTSYSGGGGGTGEGWLPGGYSFFTGGWNQSCTMGGRPISCEGN